MSDPTPTPIPPTPTNWPKLLTDLWSMQPVKLAVGVLAIFGLGMAFEGWRQHQPAVPVPVIEFTQAEVTAMPGQYVTVRVKTSGRTVKWKADPRLTVNVEMLADAKAKQFMSPMAGRYWIASYTATAGWLPWHAEPSDPAHCVVIVGTPPVPPGPTPVPPVPPVPPQPPAPIPGEGFRVLIVYPSEPGWKPTGGQLGAMYGGDVQSYLRSKCVRGPDGRTPEFRMYPDNIDLSNESQNWKDALAKAKALFNGKFPCVLIANGDKGTAQPLPTDPQSMLKLLQSIGG